MFFTDLSGSYLVMCPLFTSIRQSFRTLSTPRKITANRASAMSLRISSSSPIITVAWQLNERGRERVVFQAMISVRSCFVKFLLTKKLSSEKNTVSAPAS